MPPSLLLLLLLLLAGPSCRRPAEPTAPLVFAASSLQESLNEAADLWAAKGHERPVLSFASSAALARQIEGGAGADLFLAADRAWMDHVAEAGLIRPGFRRPLLGNRLVLVAPIVSAVPVTLARSALRDRIGSGRMAMPDPEAVPAGRYGRASLERLALWGEIDDRLAVAENVRSALRLVERAEVPLGLVYATDALASDKVRVVARIPSSTHQPIVYPAALLEGADRTAERFYDFLFSPEASAVFARHGFIPPSGTRRPSP